MTEADKQFFLGLYRCAVREYQPKIEKQTGIRLGPISVYDFRELDGHWLRDFGRRKLPWRYRLFRRSAVRENLRQWRDYLDSTCDERALRGMASYYRRAIYISFSHDIRCHEEHIAAAVVHELSHALWETIEGLPLHQTRVATELERQKFGVFVEGFATYAEYVWFLDVFPECVKRVQRHARPPHGGVHDRGMRKVAALVQQHGPEIFLEIPRRWRDL